MSVCPRNCSDVDLCPVNVDLGQPQASGIETHYCSRATNVGELPGSQSKNGNYTGSQILFIPTNSSVRELYPNTELKNQRVKKILV